MQRGYDHRVEDLKAVRDQAKADAERAEAMLNSSDRKAVAPQIFPAFAYRAIGTAAACPMIVRSSQASCRVKTGCRWRDVPRVLPSPIVIRR